MASFAVNVVTLDQYTAGVVPREMPISWQRNAVEAQALAARSYGRYAVNHPRSARYDICDTTDCQVYGGKAAYTSGGSLRWTDAMWAAKATSNQVIAYHNGRSSPSSRPPTAAGASTAASRT